MREAILAHSLPLVARFGWTRLAVEEACKSLHLPPTCHGLLPGGGLDLIAHAVRQNNHSLAASVRLADDMPMRQRLKVVVRARLAAVLPLEKTRWAQAVGKLSSPSGALMGLQLLHETVDEIVHVCGDQSTDLAWYSKRAGLGMVYAATELHMLADMSPEKEATWEFLSRRIDNYANAFQLASQASKIQLKM